LRPRQFLAQQHVSRGDHGQIAAAEGRRIDVERGHAEQRAIHAEQRDAVAPAQLGLRVRALDVEEFVRQRPDLVPGSRVERAGGQDLRANAIGRRHRDSLALTAASLPRGMSSRDRCAPYGHGPGLAGG
jgi:hypothetical protein